MIEKKRASVRIVASRDKRAIRRCCRWRIKTLKQIMVEAVSIKARFIIIA